MTTNLLSVIEQQHKALKKHAEAPMDWACAECRPNSDMLKDGFQCGYHAALAAGKQALEQTQGEATLAKYAHGEVLYLNPQMEHDAEEAECVSKCLNDRGVPKTVGRDSLSLWGRVQLYARGNDQNLLERFGFEIKEASGVWICVDDCGNEREATLNERVLWDAVTRNKGDK